MKTFFQHMRWTCALWLVGFFPLVESKAMALDFPVGDSCIAHLDILTQTVMIAAEEIGVKPKVALRLLNSPELREGAIRLLKLHSWSVNQRELFFETLAKQIEFNSLDREGLSMALEEALSLEVMVRSEDQRELLVEALLVQLESVENTGPSLQKAVSEELSERLQTLTGQLPAEPKKAKKERKSNYPTREERIEQGKKFLEEQRRLKELKAEADRAEAAAAEQREYQLPSEDVLEGLFARHAVNDSRQIEFSDWFWGLSLEVQKDIAQTLEQLESGMPLRDIYLLEPAGGLGQGVWEIKPRRRTTVRVYLSVGHGPFRILLGRDGVKNNRGDEDRIIRKARELSQAVRTAGAR